MKTVVGLYKTMAEANKVKSTLTSQGFASEHVTVIDQGGDGYKSGYEGTGSEQDSVGGKIKHFFSSLSGSDETAHNSYSQGVSSGGALLAVTVPDEQAEETADLLYQNGASDIEGGSGGSSYGGGYGSGSTGTGAEDVAVLEPTTGSGYTGTANTGAGYTGNVAAGEQVIPVVAEELQVGKREVQRGGVRIYSRVVSEPVSESISLHDERVVVDRRPVNRAATEADFATGTGAIEVTAMGEEAVVGKRSRVVEEVLVGKQASDRTEQVTDTVRHTEIEVEPTTTTTTGTGYSSTGTTGTTGTKTTGSGSY